MKCIFCEIVEGKAEAEILYEDDEVLSFLDINPLNYGHTLVIPKKHYQNFLSIPYSELHPIIKATHIVSAAVEKSLNCDGINIVSNNGKAAGQSVFHFHFHIIPRFTDDKMHPRFQLKKYKDGLKKEFAQKIRASVNNKGNLNE